MISFNNCLRSCRYYFKIFLPLFFIPFFLFFISFLIYFFYNSSFLLDEYYESNALQQFQQLNQKFTLRLEHSHLLDFIFICISSSIFQTSYFFRVKCPNSEELLQKFVRFYTTCPCIYDIQIIINENQQSFVNTNFIFEHTHSLVTFVKEDLERNNPIKTESLMLLDINIFISCNDLKFT